MIERGGSWSKFGDLDEHLPSSGEGSLYGYVECSDYESNGGDLRNGTGIKHVYKDDTWNQEHFTYDPKSHDFIGVSRPNIFWNQFLTMM